MSSKLKITLDECRISYLFKTENPIDEERLEQELIAIKYKVNKDRVITRPPLQAVILNFARKANIDIMYEKQKTPTFVGVLGKNYKNVITEFESLKHILEKMDNFILQETTGLQTVLSCRVFGGPKPDDVLPNFATTLTKKFNEKFTKNFLMDNFTLKSNSSEENTSIHVAPLYRDRRYFYMQLVLNSSSLEETIGFVEGHEKYINDIMDVLTNG